ncbi:hypothetical protein B9G69_016085 [Bdellovibrio sp. SKB1291214]|uniref:hypothetical protein n=1 Tax=Bdellovibrio sp. SKB1291214 TaxID=1732569 RepID=UPI000B5166E1|nr:hypothetical protein [Bdellovibrio sp. SKB1291214]UYL08564.1 hypothetical protein B9G69_016085 [Bdellovibrio sp. SKB1291214]
MKIIAVLILTIATSNSWAEERFNHITCEYQKTPLAWEFMAVDYNREGFELRPGESKAIVSAWTTTRVKNLGFCVSLRGTSTPSTVETILTVFEGSDIFGIDYDSCQPSGANISIIKKETLITRRGDVVEMFVDNWWDEGQPMLLLKHYISQQLENAKVSEIAPAKCAELKPPSR